MPPTFGYCPAKRNAPVVSAARQKTGTLCAPADADGHDAGIARCAAQTARGHDHKDARQNRDGRCRAQDQCHAPVGQAASSFEGFPFGLSSDSRSKTEAILRRRTLTDAQWARIEPLVPGKAGDPGRSGADNRLFIDARHRAIPGRSDDENSCRR